MDKYVILYLAIINAAGFAAMYSDKQKSIRKQWRTPESHFFIISALGGAIGVYTGMHTFRHKTKHLRFTLGVPAILALQLAVFAIYF